MNDNIPIGIPKAKFYGLEGQLITLEEWENLIVSDKITCKGVGNMPDGEYIVKSVTHEELK
jgi:hypothetical protein